MFTRPKTFDTNVLEDKHIYVYVRFGYNELSEIISMAEIVDFFQIGHNLFPNSDLLSIKAHFLISFHGYKQCIRDSVVE